MTGRNSLFSEKMSFWNLFFSMTIVSLHVVGIWGNYYSDTDKWSAFLEQICYSAMPYFFFMSGFWALRNFTMQGTRGLFCSRTQSLLVPFLLWGGIKIALTEAIGLARGEGMKYALSQIPKLLLFMEIGGTHIMPLNGPLWYLVRLYTYILSVPFIYLLLRKRCVGLLVLTGMALGTIQTGYYTYFGWIFVFCLGAFVGMHHKEAFEKWMTVGDRWRYWKLCPNWVRVGLAISFYILLWKLLEQIPEVAFLKFSDGPFRRLVCAFVCISVSPITGFREKTRNCAFLMYCSHAIFATWYCQIIHDACGRIPWGSGYIGLQQLIVCIFIYVSVGACFHIGMWFCPSVLSILTGGRVER